ncbi:hypothetical protein BDW72DRAFT_163435 [Aspergillus terricola var. indicus]
MNRHYSCLTRFRQSRTPTSSLRGCSVRSSRFPSWMQVTTSFSTCTGLAQRPTSSSTASRWFRVRTRRARMWAVRRR